MRSWRWTAAPVAALLWLVAFPAAAGAGYDIAHIVERTCEPGGPLIVTDEWKRPQDRARTVTKPGEVIACPPAGRRSSFQIAAGPERIGRETLHCTYFSLLGDDGADVCLDAEGAGARVRPLMAVQADRSDRLALVGVVSADVASVAMASAAGPVIPIERDRAARLGATRAFAYFSLPVDRGALCADEAPRVIARDSSGRHIAASEVPAATPLLSAADRVPHARSLDGALCTSPAPALLTKAYAMLRFVLRSLI